MPLSSAPSPERWQQIEQVFFAALDCPPAARAAALRTACGGDAELEAEVAALLAASDHAGGYLETLDAVRATALLAGADPEQARPVGPYAIIHEIGRGGMGVVYLAERADGQFEQRVALKLLKRGMDSEAILRRFLNERQILARLQHPHIARLLDGGLTDDGRPYFAMEYVEGRPITSYCDLHRLGIDARLRLFTDVCRAVQYAHQNLIVHRDLKPSNILVTETRRVKLLDFGIAKLLGGDEAGAPITETGLRVMTPEYAAPEQVRGEPVTTAADVYGLGVVLYELLTGRRPYPLAHRTPGDIERAVLKTEPALPSTAVGRTATAVERDGGARPLTPESVGAARGLPPERLRRRLAGDLDTIVLKALRKEPERRYASAEAFCEDLLRHLAGAPVRARKDTPGYRARAFVRRHRVGVAATLLVFLSLTAGLGTALWQASQKSREAAKAEEVKQFVLTLFAQADPDLARGREITVHDLLDQGAERVQAELAGQPEVQAEMLEMLGHTYHRLGQYDTAVPLLERALTLRRGVYGPEHPDVATVLNILGLIRTDQGRYAEADSLLRSALAMRRRLLGDAHLDLARTLNALAMTHWARGEYDQAEPLLRETQAMHRRLRDVPAHDIAENLSDLALVLQEQGAVEAAEPLYREALATYDARDRAYATSLNNLAILVEERGDYATAERYYRESLAIRQTLFDENHPDIAESLNNLSVLLLHLGAYADAEPLIRRTLAIDRTALGDEHPYIALDLDNLAEVVAARGDPAAALPIHEEALALHRRLLDPGHPSIAKSLNKLGVTLTLLGRYREARARFTEALALYRARLGPDHRSVVLTQHLLAGVHHRLGQHATADSLYRGAIEIARAAGGATQGGLGVALVGRARVLLALDRPAEAERLLEEARHLGEQRLRPWQYADLRVTLGRCLTTLGRYEEAATHLRAGLDTLAGRAGPDEDRILQEARAALAVLPDA